MKFVDLFSGIGGFHAGVAAAVPGAECVMASDIDQAARLAYTHNWGLKPVGDITQVAAEDVPAHDLLAGGFPCQAFSISGKGKGFADTRGTLFFDIMRIASHHRPAVILLENVPRLESHDGGRTFEVMLSQLERLGYAVRHKVLNAAEFGVPQHRKRIFLVCFLDHQAADRFEFPEGVPYLQEGRTFPIVADIIRQDTDAERYRIKRPDFRMVRDDLITPERKSVKVGIVNYGGQGDRVYSVLGGGITLSAHGGGNAAKTGGYLVNGVPRKLSPQETLAMNGFPEDFEFVGNDNAAWRQSGNSVVVPVVKSLVQAIKTACQ